MGVVDNYDIPAYGNGSRDDDTCSVDRLECALQVDLPSYFFDQDWGQALRPQFLMDAEIVDLACGEGAEFSHVSEKRRRNLATYFPRTCKVTGTPEINATSFLLEETRTPMCHSLW